MLFAEPYGAVATGICRFRRHAEGSRFYSTHKVDTNSFIDAEFGGLVGVEHIRPSIARCRCCESSHLDLNAGSWAAAE